MRARHATQVPGRHPYFYGSLPLQFAEVGGRGGVPHQRGLQVFLYVHSESDCGKLLGETAKSVLNGDKAVSVKLAGEVIPSL